MTAPTWSVGQVLTASDVNTWFVPQEVTKSGGQTVTSSTTLVNDTQLVLPVAANAQYALDLFLWYDGGTFGSSDMKCTFALPTGSTCIVQALAYNAGGSSPGNDIERLSWQSPFSIILGTEGTGTARGATIRGSLTTSSTSGSCQFQWAQNTSNGTATTVHSGSYLKLDRVG